jgi:hypothetical protein
LDRYGGGTTWTRQNTISLSESFGFAMVVTSKDAPIVAYRNGLSNRIYVSTLDAGGNWVAVGNLTTPSSTTPPKLAIAPDDRLYLMIGETDNYSLFSYANGTWSQFANGPGGVSEADLAVDAAGNPYVAYINSGTEDALTVLGYLSGQWLNVGTAYRSALAVAMDSPALAVSPNGVPHVGFNRRSNQKNAIRTSFEP